MQIPTAPLPIAGSDCCNENIFMLLEKMPHEHPLPPNVIPNVNPYNYAPSNLPDGIWFLGRLNENEPIENGLWKVKGEACELFSNSTITGWRTTLEYSEIDHKTDWVMEQYSIKYKDQDKSKETNWLCRVFVGSQQNTGGSFSYSTGLSVAVEAQNASSSGITNESTVQVKKDEKTQELGVTGEAANEEADSDYISRGDYLEMRDLDDPAASSSDDSSCLTMSSDECFDSLALLKELDSEIKDPNFNFNISTASTPNQVLLPPASPGSFIGIKAPSEEIIGTHSLPEDPRDTSNAKISQNPVETPSTSQNGGRKGKKKKKKNKNKYMCFMPFYFLF